MGENTTRVGQTVFNWKGSGWTGQVLLFSDPYSTYLLIGSLSHKYFCYNLSTSQMLWEYKMPDAIKGTASLMQATWLEKDLPILIGGSRKGEGVKQGNERVFQSLQALELLTGNKLWAWNVPKTVSYSRDNDGSALILDEKSFFYGAENGYSYRFHLNTNNKNFSFTADYSNAAFDSVSIKQHRGNQVIEASPLLLDEAIIVASGSGWLKAYAKTGDKLLAEKYIGSDIDGTPVKVSSNQFLLALEKQYVAGRGGLAKIALNKSGFETLWYLALSDQKVHAWQGGIIGSPAVNTLYKDKNEEHLFAVLSVQGELIIGSVAQSNTQETLDWNNKSIRSAKVYYKEKHFAYTISTPIFTEGRSIIIAGSSGVKRLQYTWTSNQQFQVTNEDHVLSNSTFHSTPVHYNGSVYIGSRDGYLYCIGKPHSTNHSVAGLPENIY